MSTPAALYQQFDPTRPLEADEQDLYVDWQQRIAPDDIKKRLANSIAYSGPIPVCRLFTGHRGVGKTTELKRVKRILESSNAPRRLFVSFLEAEQWMDLQDVGAPDIVFHIVRQLIDDLADVGFSVGKTKFQEFFKEFWKLLNKEVELKDIKVPVGPAEFGIALKEIPGVRATLRRLLEGHLPTIYHLINDVILIEARKWLKENHGYEDILVIVDELDRVEQKVLNPQGLTNHENIFLNNSRVLRFLSCDVLYTIPIDLAYSHCRERLKEAYSAEILDLPVIPVSDRNNKPSSPGLQMLREIVVRRTRKAGATLGEFFTEDSLLERLCTLSGGHVRNLFILLRSAIDRCDQLPLTPEVVERTIRRQASDIALPFRANEWEILRKIHQTKQLVDEKISYQKLRNLFVFSYADQAGVWYDWNPLLGELAPGGP